MTPTKTLEIQAALRQAALETAARIPRTPDEVTVFEEGLNLDSVPEISVVRLREIADYCAPAMVVETVTKAADRLEELEKIAGMEKGAAFRWLLAELATEREKGKEAWRLIFAMEGQESWDRAQEWLRANIHLKPEGVNADWLE